jgi:hypothetical protein
VRKSLFQSPMGRREFLQQTGIGLATTMAAGRSYAGTETWRASRIIPGQVPRYVPGNLPMKWADEKLVREAVNLHPFDLQGRMKLAANAQTTCVDRDRGYISYSVVNFQSRPPHMHHVIGDFVDDMGRHTDSLWLNRSATSTRLNDEIVHKIAQNAMDDVAEGIAWDPAEKPFINWWTTDPKDRPRGRWAHLPENTRVILGMITYYRATGDPRALETARSMVQAFYNVAEKNDKYLWFPDYNYEQMGDSLVPMRVVNGAWVKVLTGKRVEGHIDVKDPHSGTGDMGGDFPAAVMGMLFLPLVRYYENTKDPLAAELAIKFCRLIVDLMPRFAENMWHTHSSLSTVSGVFRIGQVLAVRDFQDWAENAYASFISRDYIPDFGWTPEISSRPRKPGFLCCETCGTVDYLESTIQLATNRDEKHWDRAERIAMNQLLEGQMLRVDFVDRIPEKTKAPVPDDPQWFFSADHVMNRSLGCFAIDSGPNDWVQMGVGAQSLQCCFGSGPRGLYDAWYYAAQEKGDTVQVSLQFSKRLPSAVITSYMPGKAMLEIEMTAGKKLRVRKPGWAKAERTRVVIAGKEKKVPLEGTYLELGYLAGGTKVRVEFPDETVRKTERIGEVEFRTVWRGNAVVEMEPAGEIYPLYQGRNRQDGVIPLPYINPHPINPL